MQADYPAGSVVLATVMNILVGQLDAGQVQKLVAGRPGRGDDIPASLVSRSPRTARIRRARVAFARPWIIHLGLAAGQQVQRCHDGRNDRPNEGHRN